MNDVKNKTVIASDRRKRGNPIEKCRDCHASLAKPVKYTRMYESADYVKMNYHVLEVTEELVRLY